MAKDDSKQIVQAVDPKLTAMGGWTDEDLYKEGFSTEFTHSFKEVGEKARGIYQGPGTDILLKEPDPETGELTTKRTWRIRSGNATVRVIGCHELDGFFGALTLGTNVAIEYIGMVDIPGSRNRVKRFKTFYKNAPMSQQQAASQQQANGAVS